MSLQRGGRGRGWDLPSHPRGGGRGRGYDGGGRGGGRGGGGRGGRGGRGGGPPQFLAKSDPRPIATRDAFLTEAKKTADEEKLVSTKSAQTLSPEQCCNPVRPGFGTQGEKIVLYSNHMKMTIDKAMDLHRYDISFPKDLRPKGQNDPRGKKRKRLVELLLQDHLAEHASDFASDYSAVLISKTKLPISEAGSIYDILYRADDEDGNGSNEPGGEAPPPEVMARRTYKLRLVFVKTHSLVDLFNTVTGTNAGALIADHRMEIIQSLNIVIGSQPKASRSVASIGANRHYTIDGGPEDKLDLGAGLTAIRGFFVSVRAGALKDSLLLNVQVKNGAFYQGGPLTDLMRAFLSAHPRDLVGLSRFLKRVSIYVTHLPTKKNKAGVVVRRPKAIFGLATKMDGKKSPNPPKVGNFGAPANQVQFFIEPSADKKGKKTGWMTVKEHFESEWPTFKGKLDSGLPVVNTGDYNKPIYYPPEVCVVVPGQPSSAMLNPNQTANMILHAVRAPALNAKSIIETGVKTLGLQGGSNKILARFGISIDTNLVTVQARVLAGPTLRYFQNKAITPNDSASWNMAGNLKYTKDGILPGKWTVLHFDYHNSPVRDARDLQEILDVGEVKKRFGVHRLEFVMAPNRCKLPEKGNPEPAIENWVRNAHKAGAKLLLVMLPTFNTTGIYNMVKRVCDVSVGIHSICVQETRLPRLKSPPQYWANVDLKLNLKLGGINQSLDKSELGLIAEGKTMVVGLDVTHPSPGSSRSAPSVAALVSSVDAHLAQWPAQINVQTPRQEQVDRLCDLMVQALRKWQARNANHLPENIIVCRDGVSEGQYTMVQQLELPELRKACAQVYPPSAHEKQGLPRFTVVVVGKRHHTRFYPASNPLDKAGFQATSKNRRPGDEHKTCENMPEELVARHDGKGNTPPGTVVDRGVTEIKNWDFYLQAHAALQGTARPAHYFVVHDEIFRRTGILPSQGIKNFSNVADSLESLMHNMCYLFGRATKAVSYCPPAYYADIACERARCYLSGLFEPDTPSESGASTKSTEVKIDWNDLSAKTKISPLLKDTMFYV